jgi:hypothetical protein
MRKAARVVGMIWIAMAVVVGAAFAAFGVFRGSRLDMIVAFGMALPGFLLWRWGRGLPATRTLPVVKRVYKPPLEPADDNHTMRLDS